MLEAGRSHPEQLGEEKWHCPSRGHLLALGLQWLPRDPFPGHQNPQISVLPAPGRLRVNLPALQVWFWPSFTLHLCLVSAFPAPLHLCPLLHSLPSPSHRLLSWGLAAPAAPVASCFLQSIRFHLGSLPSALGMEDKGGECWDEKGCDSQARSDFRRFSLCGQ